MSIVHSDKYNLIVKLFREISKDEKRYLLEELDYLKGYNDNLMFIPKEAVIDSLKSELKQAKVKIGESESYIHELESVTIPKLEKKIKDLTERLVEANKEVISTPAYKKMQIRATELDLENRKLKAKNTKLSKELVMVKIHGSN